MVGVWSGLEERRSRLVGEGNWTEEKGTCQERGKTQAKEEEEGRAAWALSGGALGAGVTSLESSSKGLLFLSKGLIFPSLLSLSSFIHSFGHTFTFIQQIFIELLMLQAS